MEIKWIPLTKAMPPEEDIPFSGYSESDKVLVTFENPDVFYGFKKKDEVHTWRIVVPVIFRNGMVATVTVGYLGVPIAWAEMPKPYEGDADGVEDYKR